MSAEAAKLFETLQESPLPLAQPPEINEESVRPTPLPYYKTAEEKIKWMEATALKERNHHYGLVIKLLSVCQTLSIHNNPPSILFHPAATFHQ